MVAELKYRCGSLMCARRDAHSANGQCCHHPLAPVLLTAAIVCRDRIVTITFHCTGPLAANRRSITLQQQAFYVESTRMAEGLR